MKRIDKATERKLYWLFIPMGMVVVWIITYLWFDINLLERCFGVFFSVSFLIQYPTQGGSRL